MGWKQKPCERLGNRCVSTDMAPKSAGRPKISASPLSLRRISGGWLEWGEIACNRLASDMRSFGSENTSMRLRLSDTESLVMGVVDGHVLTWTSANRMREVLASRGQTFPEEEQMVDIHALSSSMFL
jgi:hypothetical protein